MKKSAEKSKPKGKMKKRKSDASHEKREEEEEEGEEEGEEEEELRLPPLPSTRLSKEALIDKFKNFEDIEMAGWFEPAITGTFFKMKKYLNVTPRCTLLSYMNPPGLLKKLRHRLCRIVLGTN